ncbi:MAG TPA: hypothetical protein VFK02_27775 [Kofleriaceae bacterium]|nr:hypothetical protein [Kofleriaceae bacterium]
MSVASVVSAGMVVTAGLACGSTAHQITIGPPPPRDTHAVLAGGLCADNRCTCRSEGPGGPAGGDGGVGVPETKDRKRYEFRLGPSPQELWVTINQTTVLYKSPERAEACFYVDLPTGAQQVELRASNPDGVSAAWQIHELGTRTRSWYDTFAFQCGAPGVCSFEELDANKAQLVGLNRQLLDRCGTTKVKGISWDHGKAPDQLHPSELLVRITLDIYRFAAWKQHGDDTCGQGGGRRGPSDEPAPAPDDAP